MNKCKHYDPALDCCKYHSDWSSPMPDLTPCIPCEHYSPITNFDNLKAMSVEEMANLLGRFCGLAESCEYCPFNGNCPNTYDAEHWKEWLAREVSDG